MISLHHAIIITIIIIIIIMIKESAPATPAKKAENSTREHRERHTRVNLPSSLPHFSLTPNPALASASSLLRTLFAPLQIPNLLFTIFHASIAAT